MGSNLGVARGIVIEVPSFKSVSGESSDPDVGYR